MQGKLCQNQQSPLRNNKAYSYLLRGLDGCGRCRLSAHGRTTGRNDAHHYYVCRDRTDSLRVAQGGRCTARYAAAVQFDALVREDLCKVLTEPDPIAHAVDWEQGGHRLPQKSRVRIANSERAKRQWAAQQERLLEPYLANLVLLPEFERKRHELRQEQEAVEEQVAELEATDTERAALGETLTLIEALCQQVRPVLESASFAQRRQQGGDGHGV